MTDTSEMSAAATGTGTTMSDLYAAALAATENRETEEQRAALKALVTQLVRYSCKISCQRGKEEDEDAAPGDWVEIFVMSESRRRITDYLEIQPSGAVGVIFDLYDDPEKPAVGDLSDRCDAYNDQKGVSFEEHDDDEEGDEDGDGEEDDAADA
jgi:Rad3-related DNA helicase